jgi:bifunctional non-homologous end joining protein LigD
MLDLLDNSLTFIPPAVPRARAGPPTGKDWLHEIKFDGWRAQAHVDNGSATLFTRNGIDTTQRFKGLAVVLRGIAARTAVIDAELVAVDEQGRCDFVALHRRRPAALCIRAFDLLHLNGIDYRPLPLVVRRARLQRLVAKAAKATHPCLMFSDAFDDPVRPLAAAEEFGLEGIVSKRKTAPYVSGPRSGWLKIKTKVPAESQRGALANV